MVLLVIIPMKNGYFIGNIPYFQTNPYWLLIPHFLLCAASTMWIEICSTWAYPILSRSNHPPGDAGAATKNAGLTIKNGGTIRIPYGGVMENWVLTIKTWKLVV